MSIASVNPNFQEHNIQNFSRRERLGIWIHEHPTTTKVMKIAGLLIGVGMLAALPFTAPLLSTGVIVTLSITGSLLTLASIAAMLFLEYLVPPSHDMSDHVFQPKECEGGKLFYQGDVPILTLESDDPYVAGKAHGYLCGDAINQIIKNISFALYTLQRDPRASDLPKTITALKEIIPSEILIEMNGLIDGYNEWISEQYFWKFPKKITVDDLLLIHLLPDSLYFEPKVFENNTTVERITPSAAAACSAVIDKDTDKKFVFARNMDWPSFGVTGTYSLIINRKHRYHNTIEVGMPGFVGTLTGMNQQGLSLAMNVATSDEHIIEIKGMPACIYNRICLQECDTVEQVEEFINSHSPMGPYHLTTADSKEAKSFHFYQGMDAHIIRSWTEEEPLVTLNYRYNPHPHRSYHNSNERQRVINQFLSNRGNEPLADVLTLPYVNNWVTTHKVIMEPATKTFKVAFNNAFAGKDPLHEIPARELLEIEQE